MAQLGFGWGKGRRVITRWGFAPPLPYSDTLKRALEQHQRRVYRQLASPPPASPIVAIRTETSSSSSPVPKYFRGARLQGEKLRMAKATLRGLGR